MPFKKEPRYWVRRYISVNPIYLNKDGDQTQLAPGFGGTWSNGEPGSFTLHQAKKAQANANSRFSTGDPFCYVPVANSYA